MFNSNKIKEIEEQIEGLFRNIESLLKNFELQVLINDTNRDLYIMLSERLSKLEKKK